MALSPEEVIAAQLVAYNNRDLDAFLALHADDAVLYSLPDNQVIAQGQANLRERYSQRFVSEGLHCEVVQRIVRGSYVIDHEYITGMVDDKVVKVVAIYEVEAGLIQKVWFIFD